MTPEEARQKTKDHMLRVGNLMFEFADAVVARSRDHDTSKLQEPEASIFEENTPKLAGLTYGSQEYMDILETMRPALTHHYAENSHHPEHYENGVNDMTLLDLVEMFFDWKAAVERHDDGSIMASIEHNTGRFKLDPQVAAIFRNTAKEMGWE